MARIWGVEVHPVNNCLMTTILGAAATTSSCCLFRENEFSTQAGLLSLSSGPHHNACPSASGRDPTRISNQNLQLRNP